MTNYWSLQKEFRSLGCTDEAQTTAACQVYIELCEVRQKTNVKYHYSGEINKIYVTVSNKDDAIESFYLAIPCSMPLDLTATESIQSVLIQAHAHEINEPQNVSIILAIVDPSTTIIYYKLTLGMISLESMQNKKSVRQQKLVENDKTLTS